MVGTGSPMVRAEAVGTIAALGGSTLRHFAGFALGWRMNVFAVFVFVVCMRRQIGFGRLALGVRNGCGLLRLCHGAERHQDRKNGYHNSFHTSP